MLKFLKQYFYLLILPICLIIGLIRKSQLDNSNMLRFGYVHSAGLHTLIAFIGIGVYFTVVSMIVKQLYESRYTKGVKVKVSMFIGVVSLGALLIATCIMR